MGRLAKTDRIDARMLAEFAAMLVRRDDLAGLTRPLAEAQQQVLAAMVTRRCQLVTMMQSERQRLQLAIAIVRPSTEVMIEAIRRQFDDVEAQMVSHVQAHYAELDKLSRSNSGIGPVASASLTTARHNPAIKTFYDRLLAAGKLPKVTLVACMRKLQTIPNAMVKTNKPWDKSLHGA
jgi:transposase